MAASKATRATHCQFRCRRLIGSGGFANSRSLRVNSSKILILRRYSPDAGKRSDAHAAHSGRPVIGATEALQCGNSGCFADTCLARSEACEMNMRPRSAMPAHG
jgi:hypothetical protein